MQALRTSMVVALVALLAACGGGGDAAETTTTAAETGSAGTVDMDDMPQECIDALVGYLRAIEPTVEQIDFETTTADDLEALGTELDTVGEEYSTVIEELDCPEPAGSSEEAFAAIVEIAESEAPGTVGYLEWVQSFATGVQESEVSGDCETDMAALQEIVDEGGTMGELSMVQVVEVGSLVASVSTTCPPEQAEEFFAQEDVAAFLEEE